MDDNEVKLDHAWRKKNDHWQLCKQGAGWTINDNQTQEVMSEYQRKVTSPTGYVPAEYRQRVRVSYT